MSERFNDYESELEAKPTFEEALEELQTEDDSLPSPALIVGLSGLSQTEINQLLPVWDTLAGSYRRILMQMLVDAAASNYELDFRPIGYATLQSDRADVRQAAIELLWEDETTDLLQRLLVIATEDPVPDVRAEAIKQLGRFVLLGEMDDIPEPLATQTQDMLLQIINDAHEDILVRAYAVEAIGNCTRDGVPKVIAEAYADENAAIRLSAIVAMGRSCDDRWENHVLDHLDDSDDEMRVAAIRAAGELGLSSATEKVIRNIEAGDREEQEVAIWALGEIGGRESIRTLESLLEGAEEAGDERLMDVIDDALGNASLAVGDFMMVDFTDLDD